VTDETPPPHLDDEDLSALLDGEAGDRRALAHLSSCSSCAARRDALAAARDALRAASVAPLAGAVLDRLVATALEAPAEAPAQVAAGAPVRPIGRARTRRLTSPPPAWLLGAVASIAVLAGLAGLLRSGGGDDRSLTDAALPAEESGVSAEGAFDQRAVTNEAAAVDPELVTADLGDIADAASLTAALDASTTHAFAAGRTTAGDGGAADASEAAPGPPTTPPSSPSGAAGGGAATPAAGSAPTPGARAQCRAEAEAAGGGRLGALQATAVLRWEGRMAEVLVFALAEPVDGFSRQALVLARPGCALLADPRF
jgi:hypothetical protein